MLLCFDGSEDAHRAIEVAAKLLDTHVALVLTVWEPAAVMSPLAPVGDAIGRVSGVYRELDEAGAKLADQRATQGASLAKASGFEAQWLTAEGRAWSTIVRIAEEQDVAAVVMGGRGLGAIGSAILGSVSARVLRHCHRPVLVIPPPAG